jgi:hypothetical protein
MSVTVVKLSERNQMVLPKAARESLEEGEKFLREERAAWEDRPAEPPG